MSSITRKKLPRGTSLYPEQVASPLSQAATALSGNISPEQIENAKGTFRINLHVPYIDSSFWRNFINSNDGCFSIPFTLPPLQQDLDVAAGTPRSIPNSFTYSPTAPRFYLDEISFGFDQRDESCSIADRWYDWTTAGENAHFDGEISFDGVTKLNIKLALFEHEMTFWDVNEDIPTSQTNNVDLDKEVWGVRVPNVAYAGKDNRLNPVLIENIDTEVLPNHSYVFCIYATDLSQTTTAAQQANYALASVTISMKIRVDLVNRDNVATDGVQNMPTKHNGAPTNDSVAVVTPAASSVITADQAGGITSNMAIIDQVMRDKLKGGYTKDAETVTSQNLLADSSYDVIAVPLFQNRRYQVITDETVQDGAGVKSEAYWVGGGGGNNFLSDRRIIPIHYPFVLHHVILGWSWQVPYRRKGPDQATPTTFYIPNSAGFQVTVGVGMGTGLLGDTHTYEQLALHTMLAPNYMVNGGVTTWYNRCIDRIRSYTFWTQRRHAMGDPGGGAADVPWWDWELHQVPLMGSGGVSYEAPAQGKPIFTGKGWLPTWPRTNMSTGPAAPKTTGAEQFLEVRMQITDSAQLDTAPTSGEFLLSGYQGHWVYLIGKKAVL
jgi:hypothetical protein